MRIQRCLEIIVMVAVGALLLPCSSWCQAKDLSLEEILSRVQRAQAQEHEQSIAYAVTREYRLAPSGATEPSADIVAQVNFVPPAAKDYNIVSTQGNDRGAVIVRKVLDHEARMAGHAEQYELSASNYDFALLGHEKLDGRDCYVLQLSPKRRAVELVSGKAWIDANNFALRKIEGSTAKSPSMWIRDLNLTVNYDQVNGVWVQTSTRAVADVRFAGPHVLTSRELEVRPAAISAQVKARPRALHPSQCQNQRCVANSAVWVAR
jgi:hypothetical protein